MTLEQALNAWLTQETGLDCYWLKRPKDADTAVVYRCISPGVVEGGLIQSGIDEDSYSIAIYHTDPEAGKTLADAIKQKLHYFSGDLSGYSVQFIEFSGGFDGPCSDAVGPGYQFHRDFTINH